MDMQNVSNQLPARGFANEQQGFDIVRVLWRWKLLPILGAIIGMCGLPALHTATAAVHGFRVGPSGLASANFESNPALLAR